jgi:predicted dehydrogenase
MASSAAEQGAAKQSVKLFDRWCYLVDEMHYYLPKDQWNFEIESVEMKPTKLHAKLTATPVETPDLEKGEGGTGAIKPVQITMDAYKDKLEIPSWYVSFQGSNGTLRYDNALFPFIYHRITKPNGEVEQRYTAVDDDSAAVGKTTFAHQLDVFTSLLKEQDEWKKAKTNQALWSSMIRNAKMAERMVAASDQTPVASWTFP